VGPFANTAGRKACPPLPSGSAAFIVHAVLQNSKLGKIISQELGVVKE